MKNNKDKIFNKESMATIIKLVQDPETTPEILSLYFEAYGFCEINAEIMKNANVETKLFIENLKKYKKESFENPILPLLLLENPKLADNFLPQTKAP